MASASATSDTSKDDSTTTDTTMDTSRVDTMKVDELRAALKSRKIKTYGNKAELVERLKAAMILDDATDDNDEDDNADRTILRRTEDNVEADTHDVVKSREHAKYVPTFKDVEESMEAFSGDNGVNVSRWVNDFEETAELCEWNDVQRIIYAKRLLRGSAKIFVSYEKCATTWSRLKGALKTEFGQKINSNTVHKELCRRKKQPNESYQEYIYAMIGIASKANLELSAIIQYIIDGVNDDEVNKTILYGATSIQELRGKFDIYETMKNNVKTKQKRIDFSRKVTSPAFTTVKRCFNCGEQNHVSANCPSKSKGVKCFRCNEYGHVSSKCNKTVQKNDCNAAQTGQKKHEKEVDIQGHKLVALIDTGSDISLMRSDLYFKIGAPKLEKHIIQFRGVGCDNNVTLGQTRVDVIIDEVLYEIIFHVVSEKLLQQSLLIGSDFLNTVDVRLRQGNVTICKVENADIPQIYTIDVHDDDALDLSYIKDVNYRTEVEDVIKDYKPNKIRETGIKMRIILKDEIPIHQRPRRLSPCDMHEVDLQIKKFSKPNDVKAVQSFLGLTGYFRKFVPRYSVIARPLTNLLRADVKFKFEKDEQQAFDHLKTILTSRPVLKLYRINAETELHTDASKLGYASILLQRDSEDQMFHPVYYASGKTTPPEEKYSSYELEVLAIVKSLCKFRVYLLGIQFKIVTDCQAFTMTMNKRDLCTRVARWALLLTEFNYVIEHRPGRSMTHVDALSRNPMPTVMFIGNDNEGAIARFRQAQTNDDEIKQILNDEEKQRTSGYVVKNDLVYKEIDDEFMIVVPKALQTEIIRRAHKQEHFAVEKTEKIVKRDYWFKGKRRK